MADNFKTISDLDISFKEFMPGQVIQSAQFNDDMKDIEEKVNEVIGQHNGVANTVVDHLNKKNNPHEVTAHQVGTYTTTEIDEFIEDIKHGHLYDRSITNEVLADWSVDNRTIKDRTITASKVDDVFGSQIDISENIEITGRYTKTEVDELVRSKVGEGAYTKEEIDQKFEEFQSGQIIDKTISADKVTSDFGDKVNISNNVSILNRYTKDEVDMLISMNGLPRDWGDLSNESTTLEISHIQNMIIGIGKEFYITYITNMPIAEHHVSWDGGSTFYDKTADVVVNNGINMFRHDNNTSIGTYKMVIKVVGTDGQTVTSNVFDVKIVSDVLSIGSLPVAGNMIAGQFTSPATSVLDIDVKENVEARGEYNSVGERLDSVDSQIKDIAKDVLLEDGKLYLKKSDGTKLGTGVMLPVGGGGGSVTWESVTGKPATFVPSAHSHSKSDITDFPTIPTVSNDLTNALKANYDSAYTHSTSAHAPSTAQKNSDITKEEIEAKLTGEISSHSHPNSGQSEKKWRLIKEVTLSEDVNSIFIDKDVNNNPFALEELMILGRDVKTSSSTQLMVSCSQGGTIVTTLNDFINTKSKSLYVKLSHIGNYFLVQSRSSEYNIFGVAGDRIADRFSNFYILDNINIFIQAGIKILANSKFEIWGR